MQKTMKENGFIRISVTYCHHVFFRVARPSQVYFTGEVKGESAMKVTTDVGSSIDYEFRVTTGLSNT